MLFVVASILLIFITLLLSIELSFENYSVIRFELDKKQELPYALVMEELLEREREVISSLQIATTLIVILFAFSTTLIFSNLLTGFIVALALLLLFSRVVATIVARFAANSILSTFIYLAKGVTLLFSPFVSKEKTLPQPIEKEESSEITILQNAINFSEVKVKECMVPRTEVCALPDSTTYRELMDLFQETKYSRIPIYSDSIDRVVGYIHSKDLFLGEKGLEEIIRPIDSVSEEEEAQELLTKLIKTRSSIAVVLDEYGGTAGIVTLEDLIEEIFGEISDELDKEDLAERRISDSQFLFSGRLEVKYLNKSYDLEIPESDEYETLSGFITWLNEDIPVAGESLNYNNYHFSIVKMDSNRVESVIVRIVVE